MTVAQRTWWKDGTAYQIWPASYKDSNGDGFGDIPGIISTLDYLKDLGVDIVWVSPMYDSPQVDMGYDISNFEDIYHKFGSLADAKMLIKECHQRGMKLIFDLVINHTSDQHAWFRESRASKGNSKANWYIWRPAKFDENGKRRPPNNWRAHWGGSAWQWVEERQEYYLHLFAPEQPDLNWENEDTRDAIFNSALKFWLDKGLDGFRIDTVNMYSKGNDLPDAPITDPRAEFQFSPLLFCNGPRMHEFLREMYEKVLCHYDCMTVGELPHTSDPEHVLRYVSAKEKQLNMVFEFDIVDLGKSLGDKDKLVPFKLSDVKTIIARMQNLIVGNDGWSTVFMENHDQARSISRYANDSPEYRVASGKLLAMLQATLTGTLYIYQGQEIGMINVPKDWTAEEYKDIDAVNFINYVKNVRNPGDEEALSKAISGLQHIARDNARTPMQWDDSAHAGFTTGEPWMRVNDVYHEMNVKDEAADPSSVLGFWKKMLKMRKEYIDLFGHGLFQAYNMEDEATMTYSKEFGGQKVLVCLNFSIEQQKMFVPPKGFEKLELLLSSLDGERSGPLAAYEGRVYHVR